MKRETTFAGVSISALSAAFFYWRAFRATVPTAHDRYRRVFNWFAVRYCDDNKMIRAANRIDRMR